MFNIMFNITSMKELHSQYLFNDLNINILTKKKLPNML